MNWKNKKKKKEKLIGIVISLGTFISKNFILDLTQRAYIKRSQLGMTLSQLKIIYNIFNILFSLFFI